MHCDRSHVAASPQHSSGGIAGTCTAAVPSSFHPDGCSDRAVGTAAGAAEQLGISIEELLSSYFVVHNQSSSRTSRTPIYEVELHVETAPFATWQIAGMTPPSPESEAKKR